MDKHGFIVGSDPARPPFEGCSHPEECRRPTRLGDEFFFCVNEDLGEGSVCYAIVRKEKDDVS